MKIPSLVITVVSESLASYHSHARLNKLFTEHGAPSPPQGSKLSKCEDWLKAINGDGKIDPLVFLGEILEDYMDYPIPDSNFNAAGWRNDRERIQVTLAKYGLEYQFGGTIVASQRESAPTQSLRDALRRRGILAIEESVSRAVEAIGTNPQEALTLASAILESLFKIYIEDENLSLPSKQSVKPLWEVVGRHLGFDPSTMPDDDLKKILSGMTSIVDGLGAIRTHAGSAHGQGRRAYRPEPRHARLAVNASHALATFVLETWEARARAKSRNG